LPRRWGPKASARLSRLAAQTMESIRLRIPVLTPVLDRLRGIPPPPSPAAPLGPLSTGLYVTQAPHPRNAVDIFRGEWSSRLPSFLEADTGGPAALFEDARIPWFAEIAGGVAGKSILELGPLEGGHTSMLEALGAESVLAIEANTRSFLRCLIVKELLGLRRSRFLCGDFLEYLRSSDETFDIGLASGVLYHMENPAELVDLLARRCRERLFVWTHYYDQERIDANPAVARAFVGASPTDYRGFRHTLHRQEYLAPNDVVPGFCGAGTRGSNWLPRADLLRCFEWFGFEIEGVNFDHADHPNGPALALVARRVRS
jgi:hypothetical protein